MKISIYTFVRNGIYYDFHVVDMLKHHLDFADEIIVNEGYSSDGTYELITKISPKIKVFRNRWDDSDPKSWSRKFKDTARRYCSGDWCILLDADEFIPEWEFDRIRKQLENTDLLVFPLKYLNFYGNYKVLNTNPKKFKWPFIKYTVHRNIPNIEIWGDGSNVRVQGTDYEDETIYGSILAEVHHFGFVRDPARLREKWRKQYLRNFKRKWDWLPGFLFRLFPHRWDDPYFLNDLEIYEGPYIRAVRENPQEFIRDNLFLYRLLKEKRKK